MANPGKAEKAASDRASTGTMAVKVARAIVEVTSVRSFSLARSAAKRSSVRMLEMSPFLRSFSRSVNR